MGLILSSTAALDTAGEVTVAGVDGAVKVWTIEAATKTHPEFLPYEVLGYVAKGTVDAFVIDLLDQPRGRRLPEGSFFRIPNTLIYWFHNHGTEAATLMAVIVRREGIDWTGQSSSIPLVAKWEDPSSVMNVMPNWPADATRYSVSDDDEEKALGNAPDGLFKIPEEAEVFEISHHLAVPLRTKVVNGVGASIMVAERPGTYHSTPHIHAAEQFNVAIRGGGNGYCVGPTGEFSSRHAAAGDIYRIPNMSPHWAWGKNGGGSKMVEFHLPGLHGDPDFRLGLVSMMSGDELLEPKDDRTRNIFLDIKSLPVEEIESAPSDQ